MQQLSDLRSLSIFRSLVGSTSTATAMKAEAATPKLSWQVPISFSGSFANLEITAEKLAKQHSSVQTDLELATHHTKLRRATEQINLLEVKLQDNAKHKVKHNEDLMICQGLDSEFFSTKTLWDQQKPCGINRQKANVLNEKEQLYSCTTEREKTLEDQRLQVKRIQQDNEHKESTLWSYHKEELQRIQSQAENELRKEKLRELLQVMGENQQIDQEVNSKKENFTSLMKMRDQYGRNEHELSTNIVRSLHGLATKHSGKKETDPTNQRYPGNTATVILDRDRPEATMSSFKRAIRKARAWCRFTSKPIDLSAYFGPGAEVFTTPADGTFHLTFLYKGRRLTLFIYGRDLYVKGWHSEKNGTFQIAKNFIKDPSCKFVDTGENYHDLCRHGEVSEVRIGLEALIESFEVVDKCTGVVTSGLARAIAMLAVGTSEAIRLQDVFEDCIDSFSTSYPYLGPAAPFWIRRYRFYSHQYLKYLHSILIGDPPPEIINSFGGKVTSVMELRQRIRVPLRASFGKGKFEHAAAEMPVWSPAYPDGKDWDDKQLDEDDEKYWPGDDEIELKDELKNCESEEEKQNDKAEDVRVHKVDMNIVKDHIPVNRSSIFRFSALAPWNKDFIGTNGLFRAINMVGMNRTSHCEAFLTASGRIKLGETKSSFPRSPPSFSAWRKLQFFTKFLNKFK